MSRDNPFQDLTWWVQKKRDWLFFGAIDPSLGKNNRHRDPSAILIGGYDRETQVLDVVEASIRRRLPDVIIADAIALQRDYACQLWFVESVQFQELLRTDLMKAAARAGLAMPCVPIVPLADKALRIERLQPPVHAGLIRFNAAHKVLVDQLQQWPDADHDDGPDCLEMLWSNAVAKAASALTANTFRTAPGSSRSASAFGGAGSISGPASGRFGGYRL
ncbi:phage terminase large subunit [Pannonibacter sp. SL95]|uniref:phage terminase large subunit n=1 Tax=Pannonibacter sp. SL95 TaxID=2995153 RepID=UPI00227474EB|nr:phage terminase large subunit [Pannonibacter sp. SL95]MCY1707334.1 phage terminase large subunit [Pannonibacter sp. SL95]